MVRSIALDIVSLSYISLSPVSVFLGFQMRSVALLGLLLALLVASAMAYSYPSSRFFSALFVDAFDCSRVGSATFP